MYEHPELGWQAEPDGSTRCGFGLYYDGVNCVNQLGAFSGTHTLGMFYVQVYNLPQDKRQQMQYMFLAGVAYEHDVKYYGMEQCISGIIREADGSMIKEDYVTGTSIGVVSKCIHLAGLVTGLGAD